eukprot:8704274-Ditylum_brightwellii.AAC.1
MDNILQTLGFGSRVTEEERAAEPPHSTANEDGDTTHITVAVTDGCGPVNTPQPFSVENWADMPPLDQGDGSDGSSTDTDSRKSVENPHLNLSQNSSVASTMKRRTIHHWAK